MTTFEFTVTLGGGGPGPCRCPAHCPVPPGWDRAHSDSDRPYTDAELQARQTGPHYGAYDDHRGYERAFALWRAYRRDERLTPGEAQAKFEVLEAALRQHQAEVMRKAERMFE